MTNATGRLGLPYILTAQSQRKVTHNAALAKLDVFVTPVVKDIKDTPQILWRAVSSKEGDVWIMGEHRLICGDSTDRTVDRLMDGKLADMVFTDPPYNIDYQGSAADRKKG